MDTRQLVRIFHGVTHQYLLSLNRLDGLPFPPQYFDFVRVSGLGLAIPEDEWQTVLEVNPSGLTQVIRSQFKQDIRRVMKVGAALEVDFQNVIPSVLSLNYDS